MASEGKTGGVVMSWLSTIFGIVQPLLGFEDAGKTSTKIDFTASRYTGSTMGAGDSKVLEDRNDDARLLNEGSLGVSAGVLPAFSDVVVVGAGIHSLIYAIHTRKLEEVNLPDGAAPRTVTLLEKSPCPSYKIGESTLTVFGLWLKTIGIEAPLLWRLFGAKDGLAFYYFAAEDDGEKGEGYTQFVANGPPGDFVPTLQVERKVSELLLTVHAQRKGVRVLYGWEVRVGEFEGGVEGPSTVRVQNKETSETSTIGADLVIDASGRFHRFASAQSSARIKRFDTINTHAFWAYFEQTADESTIPLRFYESCNTNHICIPEGWAWVIRLPCWEGSPLPNMIKMINYLLDLNEAKTPGDEYPSTAELVRKFDLKFRWVVSIGFALRSDVVYPADLGKFGSCEAERKFNWIVNKYTKVSQLMSKHKLIHDLYGPGTTWYTRKNLTYSCPQVTGKGWAAIGDATGFTNPLYSPGINANMATSIYAAEMTHEYLNANAEVKKNMLQKYETFCSGRIENLNRMNVFNYVCFRSPQLGPLGPLWQYLCGTGNHNFQNATNTDFRTAIPLLTSWNWGAGEPEYIDFATKAIKLLEGPLTTPSKETIAEVKALSKKMLLEAVATGKYRGRWAGLLRWYDDELNFVPEKNERDVLARRCEGCGEWRLLAGNLKCAFCAFEHSVQNSTKVLYN